MNYRLLGGTGVSVSPLCYGTMSFGGDADEKTSLEMYGLCRDRGINFFDCANVYQNGRAEEILGKCMKNHREEVVITSKAFFPMSEGINDRGASRRNLRLSLEKSLKRLNTEYVDIYFIHCFDDAASLEETFYTLDCFVREGKVLYTGVSNFAAWQIMKAQSLNILKGWNRIQCLEPMYSLLKRQAEVEILPMAESESLGVISYSPLGGGLLSGKYLTEDAEGRHKTNRMYQSRYRDPAIPGIIENFVALAREEGFDPVALAIAWAGSHPGVTAPIIGARNSEQLKAALGAMDITVTEDLRYRISSLSPSPPPATDRSELL